MAKTKICLKVLVLVLFYSFICRDLQAQRNTGSIVGVVTDSSGAVIAGAAITVTNVDTGVVRAEVSEKTGTYRVVSLPPGRYKVEASASGFTNALREGVTLDVAQDARVDFSLNTGSVQSSITVSSGTPLVNTESAELGTTLDSQQVNDLPSLGRSVFSTLPLLTPGVGSGRNRSDNVPPIRLSVNGGRALSQDLVVDGAEDLSVNINSWQLTTPILDSIQEFKVQTNAYDAENGRGTATMNIVTKSGANQFHGELYDYIRNEAFDANEYFNKQRGNKRPRLRDNLYGGTLGGPIVRDKLFFFTLYEREPLSNPNTPLSSVPTDAFKAGDFSALLSQGIQIFDPATTTPNPAYDPALPVTGSNPQYLRTAFAGNIIPAGRIDPVAKAAVAFFPEPNTGVAGAYVNNEAMNNSSAQTIWHVSPRVDYNISPRQLLFTRVKYDSNVNTGAGFWPGNNPADNGHSTTQTPSWQGVLGDTKTFSDHLVSDFRLGYERDSTTTAYLGKGKDYAGKLGLPNSNSEEFPVFNFGVPNGSYGMGPGNSLNQWEQTIDYAEIVNYLHNQHSFKFGGDIRLNQVNKQSGRADASGAFGFSGGYTRDLASSGATVGMADFLLGLPNSYTITPATFIWGARKKEASWFAQDDWKINPHLTVNLGIRQDMQFSWHEVRNRYAAFSPNVINPANGLPGGLVFGVNKVNGNRLLNFSPRAGFAWIPFSNQRTVVRAGLGRFITPGSTIEDYGDTGQGEETGYVPHAATSDLTQLAPPFVLHNGGPPATLPTLTATLGNGGSVLYVVPGAPTPNVYMWNFTISHQLLGNTLVEASYVGTRGIHLPFERSLNQVPLSKLGPSNFSANLPYPQYANISGRYHDASSTYHSFQLKLQEQFRHLNWTVAYTLAKSMDNSSLDPTTSWGGATWSGSGVQDIYNLRSNWARSAYDQRQKLGASFTYELPFGPGQHFINRGVTARVVGGWQINSIVQAHTGIPVEFQMAQNNSYSNNEIWRPDCIGNPTSSHPTLSRWFNLGAFATPANATFGNCGRDLSSTPGYQEVDLSLFKNISFKSPLGENTVIQFRAETYNTLNRTNFGVPDTTVPNTPTQQTNFGLINSTVNSPRSMTLALKFLF